MLWESPNHSKAMWRGFSLQPSQEPAAATKGSLPADFSLIPLWLQPPETLGETQPTSRNMAGNDYLKRPWCWERLKARGEGDNRGWDGWMASLTQWTCVWVNSRRWWWTGRPGMLQSMVSQRVRHNWATELNDHKWLYCFSPQSFEWLIMQQ